LTLEHALHDALDGEVRFDRITRALYATDASVYQIAPVGVVLPRTCDDVVRVVQLAAEHRTSITARGGGTHLTSRSGDWRRPGARHVEVP
jgi:FAD/FMN-containing dehydrogenase